jgi:hypothetical protein
MLEQDNSHHDQQQSDVVGHVLQSLPENHVGGCALDEIGQRVPHAVDVEKCLPPKAPDEEEDDTRLAKQAIRKVVPSRRVGLALEGEIAVDFDGRKGEDIPEGAH